jgi:hypothetical protein
MDTPLPTARFFGFSKNGNRPTAKFFGFWKARNASLSTKARIHGR